MTQTTNGAGRPPNPHYCDHPPGSRFVAGCPNWPACVLPVHYDTLRVTHSTTPPALTEALDNRRRAPRAHAVAALLALIVIVVCLVLFVAAAVAAVLYLAS